MDNCYWLGFYNKNINPSEHHVTLKFLGGLESCKVGELIRHLLPIFVEAPNSFTLTFSEYDFFGPEKDIKVIKTPLEKIDKKFILFRRQINYLRQDDYAEYSPHITVKKDYQKIGEEYKFDRLALFNEDAPIFIINLKDYI